jgi:hypothetical protein
VSPVLHNNFLYIHIGVNKESNLIKLNREGRIESSRSIPTWGGCHWKTFLFDNLNRMYYCSTLKVDDNKITKFYCFDEHFKELALLDIDGT